MKRQVFDIEEMVSVESVSKDKYYGCSNETDKGFLVSTFYKDGRHKFISKNGLTYGNGWGEPAPTIECAIKNVHCHGLSVYQFDTPNELFRWLLE